LAPAAWREMGGAIVLIKAAHADGVSGIEMAIDISFCIDN
jgi:hypothetical protein